MQKKWLVHPPNPDSFFFTFPFPSLHPILYKFYKFKTSNEKKNSTFHNAFLREPIRNFCDMPFP